MKYISIKEATKMFGVSRECIEKLKESLEFFINDNDLESAEKVVDLISRWEKDLQ